MSEVPICSDVSLSASQIDEINRILAIMPFARSFQFNECGTYSFCDTNDGNALYFMTYFGQNPMLATYIKL